MSACVEGVGSVCVRGVVAVPGILVLDYSLIPGKQFAVQIQCG